MSSHDTARTPSLKNYRERSHDHHRPSMGRDEIRRNTSSWARPAGGAIHRDSGVGGTLSPREREVVDLLAAGYGPKQIALALRISRNTVRTHMRERDG
jgi:DNA-binding NarL/FixJ family response regulator